MHFPQVHPWFYQLLMPTSGNKMITPLVVWGRQVTFSLWFRWVFLSLLIKATNNCFWVSSPQSHTFFSYTFNSMGVVRVCNSQPDSYQYVIYLRDESPMKNEDCFLLYECRLCCLSPFSPGNSSLAAFSPNWLCREIMSVWLSFGGNKWRSKRCAFKTWPVLIGGFG